MAAWTSDELETIGREDELHLASEREDGSLRDPVTIWMVRVGDDIFVRSVKGREGSWFRGTRTVRRGRVRVGEIERDVLFEDGDHSLDDAIGDEYRRKYANEPQEWVDPVLTIQARASTLRLVPRAEPSSTPA
jgi:hypothetical protein